MCVSAAFSLHSVVATVGARSNDLYTLHSSFASYTKSGLCVLVFGHVRERISQSKTSDAGSDLTASRKMTLMTNHYDQRF